MDLFFLARPNAHHVQLDLFYNYRTNAALYPEWQERLGTGQPKTLISWGQGDILFTPKAASRTCPTCPTPQQPTWPSSLNRDPLACHARHHQRAMTATSPPVGKQTPWHKVIAAETPLLRNTHSLPAKYFPSADRLLPVM